MKIKGYDYIIIGAGIYGLYIATKFAAKYPKRKICILEYDGKPFQRASYINQARVHNGYHYPRSLSTALKSSHYYNRFINDYSFAINKSFEKIYAISSNFTYASAWNFEKFCQSAEIPCSPIHQNKYFKKGVIEEAFLTEEFSLDASKISEYFISIIEKNKNIDVKYCTRIKSVDKKNDNFILQLNNEEISANFVLNATYASVNQILDLFGFEMFKIKYEIAEISLCKVSNNILNAGITVMDGPFFSVMPFGLSGFHSLSSVHHTPHKTSNTFLPKFNCQSTELNCSERNLNNCNVCISKPKTAWNSMNQLAMKYLKESINLNYVKSLYAVKAILKSSEITDSRPTIVKEFSKNPTFISVLSGKFNTMYDLDEILEQY
jgi:hypothetical protein